MAEYHRSALTGEAVKVKPSSKQPTTSGLFEEGDEL
jgi:hypothetical protein